MVAPPGLDVGGRAALRSEDPRRDLFRAARLLLPDERPAPGIHPSAVVHESARVDASAAVGPLCAVAEGVVVGAGSVLGPGAVLERHVRVGEACTLHGALRRHGRATLGDRVVVGPGAVIGGPGFGYVGGADGALEKLHDAGSVVVGDDVEIGANACIDRGSLGDTRIGAGAKIDDLVMSGTTVRWGRGRSSWPRPGWRAARWWRPAP